MREGWLAGSDFPIHEGQIEAKRGQTRPGQARERTPQEGVLVLTFHPSQYD
jgi:hypothetical protein